MIFFELAQYFARLELTTKRLELIDILGQLFSQISDAEEARQVTYLLQGRVAAFYEPVEFGIAGKLLERAIAHGVGSELGKVQELNRTLGDLGKVVEELHRSQKGDLIARPIALVFSTLQQLAESKGEGSIERKIELLAGMLQEVDALSAKYIVRIVSGTLRLGIGDVTVLEALAFACLRDRKYRADLEKSYNEVSDLGEIAYRLFSVPSEAIAERILAVQAMGIAVGRPLRSELCERMPDAQTTIEKMGKVAVQFKYDGFRTQMHLDRKTGVVKLFSRNLEETTHAFPELVKALLEEVQADSVILDSEAIAYHEESGEFLPFQETTKRRRKHDVAGMAEKLPLKAFVFDILYLNGKSLLDLPVTERLKVLQSVIDGKGKAQFADSKQSRDVTDQNLLVNKSQTLVVSETRLIEKGESLQLMLDEALSQGLEGVVIKKVDSPYEAGARNYNWVKLKHTASSQIKDTIDCVVLGYILGRGKRAEFGVGALLVGVYDAKEDLFKSISKIGTGLSDVEWVKIREKCDVLKSALRSPRVESEIVPSVWVEPEVVIEVLCDEITRSPLHTAGRTMTEPGYALRFPRLVSFREDKKAEQATSVEEIRELYSLQYKK